MCIHLPWKPWNKQCIESFQKWVGTERCKGSSLPIWAQQIAYKEEEDTCTGTWVAGPKVTLPETWIIGNMQATCWSRKTWLVTLVQLPREIFFVYLFVGNLSTFRFWPTDMFLIYLLNLGGQLNKIVLFLLEDNNKIILFFFFFLFLFLSLLPSFSSSSLLDFQFLTCFPSSITLYSPSQWLFWSQFTNANSAEVSERKGQFRGILYHIINLSVTTRIWPGIKWKDTWMPLGY